MQFQLSYTLVITGAPWVSQAPQTSLGFARAIADKGHQINRIFLYGDGVHLASSLATPPPDERNWPQEWSEFLAQKTIPAAACIASALRRGIIDESEQGRYNLTANNLLHPFIIAGLGEWVEGRMKSDRTVYFHGGA